MTTATITHSRIGPGLWIGVGVAAVAAVVVGLFGSAFAVWVVWLAGGATAVVGGIASLRRARWGFVLLVVGAGLLLGSAAYISLGLIQPDGPASGGGSSVVPAP
ncbi:hypothetical protein [Microbacterium lacticum]